MSEDAIRNIRLIPARLEVLFQQFLEQLQEENDDFLGEARQAALVQRSAFERLEGQNRQLQIDKDRLTEENTRLREQFALLKGQSSLDPLSYLVRWLIKTLAKPLKMGWAYFWKGRQVRHVRPAREGQ